MLANEILIILDNLGIKYNKSQNRVCFPCPIHKGDNWSACSILLKAPVGLWRCFTRGCEINHGKSFLAFCRAFQSVTTGREWSYEETRTHVANILGHEPIYHDSGHIKEEYVVPNLYELGTLTRGQVRSRLDIPAKYYLERGYSSEILDHYDVGTCKDNTKSMANRVVLPIYDLSGKMFGCSARSIYEKCEACGFFHSVSEECSTNRFINANRGKWKHGYNFKSGQYLYNLWYSHRELTRTRVAILVESPGNVLRLEESGIHNSVAILGSSLSGQQLAILSSFGVATLVLLFDNDLAGQVCKDRVIKNCSKNYNIINIDLPSRYKDIGSMAIADIYKYILPKTENL